LTAVPAHADAQERKSPVVITAIARELVDFIWAIAQAVPVARKTRRRSPLTCAAQADALVRLPAAAFPPPQSLWMTWKRGARITARIRLHFLMSFLDKAGRSKTRVSSNLKSPSSASLITQA
jgi:hypothetical protein